MMEECSHLVRDVERVCATCAQSLFKCGNTQLCLPMDHAVAEDYWCPAWQPLFFPPHIFGRLEDDQPN